MKKILLFHYFAGAGGKFIANCLSFAKSVAPSDYDMAMQQHGHMDHDVLTEFYLNTVPDPQNARQWLYLENGCQKLFGQDIIKVKRNIDMQYVNLNDLDALSGAWLPLMSHDKQVFENCKNYFSQDQVFSVLVDSTPDFIDFAIKKKWPESFHCLDMEKYRVFKTNIQTMQFDMIIPDWDPRIGQNLDYIARLASEIGVTLDLELARPYIEKYQNFHLN